VSILRHPCLSLSDSFFQAWSYPPHSVLFTIYHVPIEEHAFFILQPILLILLHSILTLPHMIPFRIPKQVKDIKTTEMKGLMKRGGFEKVQTLRRRPRMAGFWIALTVLGFAILFGPTSTQDLASTSRHVPTHGWTLNDKSPAFYLGCILAWISPVIALLTYLGARSMDLKGERWTYVVGIGYLWFVDT
jgi:15-cis-phytoene synthase/lycopene beta-cyclase